MKSHVGYFSAILQSGLGTWLLQDFGVALQDET